ncbi:LodA/GoxA family CTQ-dependent oxidase [Methylomonas sp. 11b]|uniref:LodA/GoxA family CTQ-dependent oxidase n=1 Tax=Methylomonas sp. 11b TaxID=1168169 RepID=UPI00047ED38F|nr:LodA/GoxA family CTQ-dependent oxidase [Methylomonas sp. 11b]
MIESIKIFPPIGIARLGKSPDSYFIGPEQPIPPTIPNGGYRDAFGLIKRQAARFRLFAFDENNKLVEEVTLDNAQSIEWTVKLANTKAAANRFFGKFDKDDTAHGLRNADFQNRDQLKLTPSPVSVSGRNENFSDLAASRLAGLAKEFTVDQQFIGHHIQLSLGTATTDDIGRLLILGGYGESKSPTGSSLHEPGSNFANHDGWYDDVSDGLVTARVTLPDGSQPVVVSAWVVVAPPKYAPGIQPIVTLYDTLLQAAVDRNLMPSPFANPEFKPSIERDIIPILTRAAQVRWVYSAGHQQFRPLGFHHTFNNIPPAAAENVFNRLSTPSANPGEPGSGNGDMPKMWSDDYPDGSNGTLTRIQYTMMKMWTEGETEAGSPPSPDDPITPAGLTRAALEPCVGAAFFPGIEVSWKTRDLFAFIEPFRLDPTQVHPGDLTSQMSLPWQSDFLDCAVESGNGPDDLVWWPAQRPVDVLKPGSNTYIPWARVSDVNSVAMSVEEMIDGWNHLAFVVEGGDGRFEELPRP